MKDERNNMGKLFDLDSPIMQVLNKVADLMWLNILTLICCLPVVTAGAALTAAHYVALKIKRNEEGYITRDFFKSFKENFKQGTIIWLLIVLIAIVLVGDFYIMNNMVTEVNSILRIIIMAVGILILFTAIWVFPVLSKFGNTVRGTIKNAFAMSILQFPKTILMAVLYVLPLVLFAVSLRLFPIVILFGFSVPIYVSAMLYSKTFKKLEDQILSMNTNEEASEEETSDDEKIFSDEPMDGTK